MTNPSCFGTQPVPSSNLYAERRCGFCDVQTSCNDVTMARVDDMVFNTDPESGQPLTLAKAWLEALRRGSIESPDGPDGITFDDGSRVDWRGDGWVANPYGCWQGECKETFDTPSEREKHWKIHHPVGVKKDQGKLRWSLLPKGVVSMVLQVLEFGAVKYSVDNWQKVDEHERRYYDATMRHIEAWRMKETNDPESGLPHLAHAVCCLMFLLWFDKEK